MICIVQLITHIINLAKYFIHLVGKHDGGPSLSKKGHLSHCNNNSNLINSLFTISKKTDMH